LLSHIDFKTPFVRAATLAEIRPAAGDAAVPRQAACTVEQMIQAGRPAEATCCEKIAANVPTDNTRPCRANRFASSFRALANRPANVPCGQSRFRAASLIDLPSKSQRTIGSLYLSGRRVNS